MLRGPASQRPVGQAGNAHTAKAPVRVQANASSTSNGSSEARPLLAPITPAAPVPSGLLLPSPRQPVVAAAQQVVAHPATPGSYRQRGGLVIPSAAATALQQPTQTAPAPPTPAKVTLFSPSQTPIFLPNGQRVHSLHETGLDVVNSLSNWAKTDLLRYLKPVEKSWQPQDYLPEPSSPDFYDEVTALRTASTHLPSDYMVVLVGDMVTEEALPSYMNMLNTLDGTRDETGAEDQPWAQWTRHWTAEENRHGDLMNKYLYLSGRVDMRSVEATIQRLIGSGLDPKLENNPYLCFIYTSFQERATKISHGNTARLAAYYGDTLLTKICGIIAADESRHEAAYTAIVDQLFQRDPEGALLAFADMMKKGIAMPAHFLDDGVHSQNNVGANLFVDYATVADNIGVYTTTDYANIVDHLVSRWRVAEYSGLSGEAAAAQEYLCAHAGRIRRLANIQAERRLRDRKRGKTRESSFDWIRGRQVSLI